MAKLLEEAKEEATRLKKEVETRSRVLTRVEAAYKETTGVIKVRTIHILSILKYFVVYFQQTAEIIWHFKVFFNFFV